jgi:hypothetical protein
MRHSEQVSGNPTLGTTATRVARSAPTTRVFLLRPKEFGACHRPVLASTAYRHRVVKRRTRHDTS